MSYTGYVHLMTDFLKFRAKQKEQKLWILEIGVDRGQTALPLLSNLLQENLDWAMIGLDCRLDKMFHQQLTMMRGLRMYGVQPLVDDEEDMHKHWNYLYECGNSLDYLPAARKSLTFPENKFDLVLLDGDHNFETVQKELGDLVHLVSDDSMIVVDDFHGRHANRDSFYSDRPEHSGIEHKELNRNSSRQGVNNAVYDFLKNNRDWNLFDLGKVWGGDAIVLAKNLVINSDSQKLLLAQPTGENGQRLSGIRVQKWALHRYCQQWHFTTK